MSRAYKGGSEVYNQNPPTNNQEILSILEKFIIDNFKSGRDVASEVVNDSKRYILKMAEEDEDESPATLGQREDELIAYGAFSYSAKDHSVQVIWENKFEIRENDGNTYVRVSDWYGPTVESWNQKVERDSLY